jgi:hypothetical protein
MDNDLVTGYQAIITPEGDCSEGASGSTRTTRNYWSFSGRDIPKYHARLRAGELLPHLQYKHFSQEGNVSDARFDYIAFNEHPQPDCHCNYSGKAAIFDWVPSEEELLALVAQKADLSRLVQGAAAAIYSQGHDTLTFLAELNKTISLVTGALSRLIDLIYRKGFGQLYLEGRYGWRILYYDIQDISKVLQGLGEEKRKRFSQRVGESQSGSSESVEHDISWSSQSFKIVHNDQWALSTRGAVTADISPPTFQFNPAITAWELTKFSFVFDWLVSVGTWLASLSFLILNEQHVASGGFRLDHMRFTTMQDLTSGEDHQASGGYDAQCYTCLKVRTPMAVSYIPKLNIKLDVWKILDLLAIIFRLKRRDGKS